MADSNFSIKNTQVFDTRGPVLDRNGNPKYTTSVVIFADNPDHPWKPTVPTEVLADVISRNGSKATLADNVSEYRLDAKSVKSDAERSSTSAVYRPLNPPVPCADL
tara:strand:- start:612 stop:929 length:318 start_codon:yes stop_codon:yes gene_type:complete